MVRLGTSPGARRSGPSTISTIVLPLETDRPISLTLLVTGEIAEGTLQAARLEANGCEIATSILLGADGAFWTGTLDPRRCPSGDPGGLRLTVFVERTYRPFDLAIDEDRRWLGLGIGWVEVAPLRED